MFSRRFSFSDVEPVVTSSAAFVACPVSLVAASGCMAQVDRVQALYQAAYERARELHRPSRWAPLYGALVN